MPRPIRATISAGAIAHNLELARRHAAGAKVWAVIKANAYGHGVERAARAARGADGFAVLDFEEAARLRRAGFAQPILMLEGMFEPDDVSLIAQHRLTPVIHRREQLEMLRAASAPLDVYLKVNSGMNRLGFTGDEVPHAFQALVQHPQVKSITLMTHFADADGATGVAAQLERFAGLTKSFRRPHSLASLGNRLVRQANDGEGRQSRRNLHLNIDRAGLDPLKSYGGNPLYHAAPLPQPMVVESGALGKNISGTDGQACFWQAKISLRRASSQCCPRSLQQCPARRGARWRECRWAR